MLEEMGVYPAVLKRELDRYMPFLATTTLLMESVTRGAGREQAHEAIKEHAVAVALEMRERAGGVVDNDLSRRLGEDIRIPLSTEEIEAILSNSGNFIGLAADQVNGFVAQVDDLVKRYPKGRLL